MHSAQQSGPLALRNLHPRTHSANMKQKIVMKVQMNCQKCRAKALQVASGTNGVNFVGIEGEGKDRVVVIGDDVDAANLTSCMRKKLGYAALITVAEVKGK